MQTEQKIGDVANRLLLSSDRCENCHCRLKHRDRKWCKRCMDVYLRMQRLTPEKAEETIMKLVEPLYFDADLDDLDREVCEKLTSLRSCDDVFMFGPVGTGKTYAMAALIRHYVYMGYDCQRINFDDFCIEIRSTFSQAAKKTEREIGETYRNYDKLFIDDLGLRSKQETDFAYLNLYSLINKRQERLLPTYISSNKSIEQLGRTFDARVASRLQTAVIIEMNGTDKRKGNRTENVPSKANANRTQTVLSGA